MDELDEFEWRNEKELGALHESGSDEIEFHIFAKNIFIRNELNV